MNKKALAVPIGMTAVVTIIAVIIIMLIFVVSSALISFTKAPKEFEKAQLSLPPKTNLLLQTTELETETGKIKVLFWDAVQKTLLTNDYSMTEKLDSEMLKLLNEKNDCLVYVNTDGSMTSFSLENNAPVNHQKVPPYKLTQDDLSFAYINISGAQVDVKYYYGPCKK